MAAAILQFERNARRCSARKMRPNGIGEEEATDERRVTVNLRGRLDHVDRDGRPIEFSWDTGNNSFSLALSLLRQRIVG